jgi:uncharacterized membrane protein YphA (DoxX/SURF4 family)
MQKAFYRIAAFALPFMPAVASAHEVYVLGPSEISNDISTPAFSEWQVMLSNMHQFLFWGAIAVFITAVIFITSLWHTFEQAIAPRLTRLRVYAPLISRVTIGLSLIAAAYYDALFGPELPLYGSFGALALVVRTVLVLAGLMLTFNFYPRIAACAMLAVFAAETYLHGEYMLTYAAYFGELAAIAFLAHKHLRPYASLLLRVCFGIGLLYSSYYAKILHNNLALQVASMPLAGHAHSLAYYFGFEPHFLVLGAALVELVIGMFFILGFEIRFTSLFLLFWLSLSLFYFGEVVWPHVVLIGVPIAFICYGYDKFSVEGYLFGKKGRDPVW